MKKVLGYWLVAVSMVLGMVSGAVLGQGTPSATVTPTPYDYVPDFTLYTKPATNITSDSATLNGLICSYTLPARTEISFLLGTKSEVYSEEITVDSASVEDIGKISTKVRGLQPATSYYYKILARQRVMREGENQFNSYSDESSFKTLSETPKCEVKTLEVSLLEVTLKRFKSIEVVVSLEGEGGCLPEGEVVVARILKDGGKYIIIPTTSGIADENGQIKFTINALGEVGSARVVFETNGLKKRLLVKVR